MYVVGEGGMILCTHRTSGKGQVQKRTCLHKMMERGGFKTRVELRNFIEYPSW